ncbi:MAG TPA: class I SAM-dependent methyltransferase [Kofleriaceae bacterium]|nr:class I SAM-dependent methyltransferase [Kofleriaceae bacterium]
MSNGSPLATPQPWDLVAPAYEQEVMPMFETFAREALRLAEPPPGSRIVDVACGPGTLSRIAARAGHTVDALDFSPRMIELLQAQIASEQLHITPRIGDGQALPYPDRTFAAAFSMFGLMFFPDRARGFAELARVLAPGARAVVSSWQPLETNPALAVMFAALRDVMSAIAPAMPGGGAPGGGAQEMPLVTDEACRAEMSASFDDVTVRLVEHRVDYPSTQAMWESIVRTMAPITLLKHRLGDRFGEVDRRVLAAMTDQLGAGAGALTMRAWLTVGTARP